MRWNETQEGKTSKQRKEKIRMEKSRWVKRKVKNSLKVTLKGKEAKKKESKARWGNSPINVAFTGEE